MAEPFIGQITLVGFNFPPRGWAQCDGALLAINQNQTLFALLGTQFGGDGRTTFALPDLRGRVPVHIGTALGVDVKQGQASGSEQVTLTPATMPQHTHAVEASSAAADQGEPTGNVLAAPVPQATDSKEIYGVSQNLVPMNSSTVAPAGGGLSHPNEQPAQVVNFCIALQGLFPSRN
jgi:microcystin-dependent protein